MPLRKQIVLSNIELVFKNTATSAEKTRLAKAFYSHVASILKELFWMGWASSKRLTSKIEIHGLEHLESAVNQNKEVFLLLTGHLGNWELAYTLGFSLLMDQYGQFNIIRRPII
ncbi:TPA: hypothetical protein ACF9VA_001924 [Legionella pneumophila]|nr:hypothetical protein [Legionella pneumophila]MDW9138176.1 hypothetical protein [Legionella pneumophila]